MAGAIHHVTARTPKGVELFRSAPDQRAYLGLLAEEVSKRHWSLRTYCLMSNHVHLLLQTPAPDLAAGMKTIHETFARTMHRRHDGHGHLFGGRFKNKPVLTTEHEVACLRYIARNPVSAGLCGSADDWEWSAHPALTGLTKPSMPLDIAAVRATISLADYRDLVGSTDSCILAHLEATQPQTWIVRALEEHSIPIATIADHLGVTARTVYRRLSAQRHSGV